MIIDTHSNLKKYVSVVDNLESALKFLEKNPSLECGKYDFDGGYIMSSEGDTLSIDEKQYENHRKYVDIMYILEGDETFCYANTDDGMKVIQPFGESDIEFLEHDRTKPEMVFTVPAGYFYIMLPTDAHKPCIHIDRQKTYKKYVIKCQINSDEK